MALHREGEEELWYYSSKPQIEELLSVLDPLEWEGPLCRAIQESLLEIWEHVAKTSELTNSSRGNQRSELQKAAGEVESLDLGIILS